MAEGAAPTSGGKSSAPMRSARARTTARSSAFSNSRTFPGHVYRNSRFAALVHKRRRLFPESFGGSAKELPRQRQDVLVPFAQRRYHDLDNPETIVQILTKPRGMHVREEIAIGGREDTHVDGPSPGCAPSI